MIKRKAAAPVLLRRNVKRRFATNDSAWTFVHNYFQRLLPILIRSAPKKPCAVFDIDYTVLHYSSPLRTPELRLSSSVALQLFNLFSAHNVPVYFVTARVHSKTAIDITRKELDAVGFKNYASIYFMPSAADDIGHYKETIRDILRSQFHILFNVGDQWTDLCNKPMTSFGRDAAVLLYNVEPGCDWALKLISGQDAVTPFLGNRPAYLDSIFETIAPCTRCGTPHP